MTTPFAANIEEVDAAAAAAARARVDALTKPLGSLGRLEDLAVQLSAIAGRVVDHAYTRKAVLIGAADHGVTEEGVSAYPAEVTPQMVGAFLAGHAAINAISRAVGADVYVADFGVRVASAPHPLLIDVAVRRGTENFARAGRAMTDDDVEAALGAGRTALEQVLSRSPYDVIALGDMGIGNTTSAAALIAALTGADATAVTGRGTGVDDARLAHKREVIARALARLRDSAHSAAGASAGGNARAAAASIGGLEIVGLAGAILTAAQRRIPIVLDGVIVTAAALLAHRIAPNLTGYCIAAHRSQEPAHTIALEALGLDPLFDLQLLLGEGSGAALALPLVEAASRMIAEMKTFAEAGVATETDRTQR
jgi:nicotinate-nucleotide--dimethylbenzimidazole phosphoribosyltransferase